MNYSYYSKSLEIRCIYGSPETTGTSSIRKNEVEYSKNLRNLPKTLKK